jgi:hypothetical protein
MKKGEFHGRAYDYCPDRTWPNQSDAACSASSSIHTTRDVSSQNTRLHLQREAFFRESAMHDSRSIQFNGDQFGFTFGRCRALESRQVSSFQNVALLVNSWRYFMLPSSDQYAGRLNSWQSRTSHKVSGLYSCRATERSSKAAITSCSENY